MSLQTRRQGGGGGLGLRRESLSKPRESTEASRESNHRGQVTDSYKVNVKKSHNLVAIGTVGIEFRCILDAAYRSRSPSLPFRCLLNISIYHSLTRNRYPFTAGLTEEVFQSSDGEARVRTHDLPPAFPYRSSPACLTFNNYFTYFYIYI